MITPSETREEKTMGSGLAMNFTFSFLLFVDCKYKSLNFAKTYHFLCYSYCHCNKLVRLLLRLDSLARTLLFYIAAVPLHLLNFPAVCVASASPSNHHLQLHYSIGCPVLTSFYHSHSIQCDCFANHIHCVYLYF